MRIAALDVGQARIGIAVCDEMEIVASGVETYTRTKDECKDMQYLADKLAELKARLVVIGMPLHMDGSEGIAAENIRGFAAKFARFCDIEQRFVDERLTTVEAQRVLLGANVKRSKRKAVIDKMAAQLILRTYLDTKAPER